MTEQEFLDFISTNSAHAVLDRTVTMPAKERRSFAKSAMALFKKLDRYWDSGADKSAPKVSDGEAITVAVLATASESELTKLPFFPISRKIPLEEVLRRLEPDWTQAVVAHFIEDRTIYVDRFKPLWKAGLCKRPESDAIILGYYSHRTGTRTEDDQEALLGGDVWRFFEVEGGGEDSLANHDKFLKRDQESWADRLKRYADEGKLDRQRLLDASLDALDRDFAQYRAGWYSRFHVLMKPDANEMAARADHYLRLLASSIPPTVSFAMKHVRQLNKSGAMDPGQLVAALEPALQARAKGTVTAALKLMLDAAKKCPELKHEAAQKSVLALISEDAAVQEKALDTIEALGHEAVTVQLAEYVDMVAPSVRERIATLAGVTERTETKAELEIAPTEAHSIAPVASAEDALALFLSVLEDPRDPFDVERAIDGVSRFGAALRVNEITLSPLRKRAKQVCKSSGESDLRYVLALTGRALAENVSLSSILAEENCGRKGYKFVPELSLQEQHLARNVALVDRVESDLSLPLLALPSESSGMVSVVDLQVRMGEYRQIGIEPDHHDLALALMRLDPEGRNINDLPSETEADRAIAYALGQKVKVGPNPTLWAAAWRARSPEMADKAITKLFNKPFKLTKEPMPDCGVPAAMELLVERKSSQDGEYHWISVKVPVTPSNQMKSQALPALFCAPYQGYMDTVCCGSTFADIAWASLTRPSNPEPFFRTALIHQDTWQKLSDNHTRAYLEPFFRPGPPVGPLGAGVLALYMACEDNSVSALAIEAAAELSLQGRLAETIFVPALKKFLMSNSLPTSRWTKALKGIAEVGAESFAKQVIVDLMDFASDDTPRDIGGMLELCYELHVAQHAELTDADAIACLQSIPGGGKTARFSKKLLSLAQPQAG
ncbi:DUF6493 family protein [Litoreibacter sp.]|nr:DUF6493 family protein [Litoreibacter sp.]